jgi:hypothetical protein
VYVKLDLQVFCLRSKLEDRGDSAEVDPQKFYAFITFVPDFLNKKLPNILDLH